MTGPRSKSSVAVPMMRNASLHSAGRDELEESGGFGGGVEERVPLAAWLDHQVADLGDVFLAVGDEPDPTFQDEAELVSIGMPVQGAAIARGASRCSTTARFPPE